MQREDASRSISFESRKPCYPSYSRWFTGDQDDALSAPMDLSFVLSDIPVLFAPKERRIFPVDPIQDASTNLKIRINDLLSRFFAAGTFDCHDPSGFKKAMNELTNEPWFRLLMRQEKPAALEKKHFGVDVVIILDAEGKYAAKPGKFTFVFGGKGDRQAGGMPAQRGEDIEVEGSGENGFIVGVAGEGGDGEQGNSDGHAGSGGNVKASRVGSMGIGGRGGKGVGEKGQPGDGGKAKGIRADNVKGGNSGTCENAANRGRAGYASNRIDEGDEREYPRAEGGDGEREGDCGGGARLYLGEDPAPVVQVPARGNEPDQREGLRASWPLNPRDAGFREREVWRASDPWPE